MEILRYDHRDATIVDDDPYQNLVLGVFHTSLEKIYNHELNTAFESIERRTVSICGARESKRVACPFDQTVVSRETYIEIYESKNYTASLIICKNILDNSHFRGLNVIRCIGNLFW